MITGISSIFVANKMNDWYQAIQNYEVEKAFRLKEEINQLIVSMEKDQTVLLYYSLLDFRTHLLESQPKQFNRSMTILDKLNNNEDKFTGLLNYYYWFFKGMYAFKKHDYPSAISCYRTSEQLLEAVDDESEKAEFDYKLAHLYYQLKYTEISIHYAERAYHFYQQHDDYLRYQFFCRNIIGLNYLDTYDFNKAMDSLTEANHLAIKAKDNRLIAIAQLNIGISLMNQRLYSEAKQFFEKSVDLFLELKDRYLAKAYFNLMEAYIKAGEYSRVETIYNLGLKQAIVWEDQEFIAKIDLVKELMPDRGNQKTIDEGFDQMKKLNLYADVESYSLDFAQYFKQIKKPEIANKYYELSISANKMIKKGQMMV